MSDAAAEPFLELVEHLEVHRAVDYVREVAEHEGMERAVVDVLAAAQHEVGRRWAAGEWTISHEKAATAIVENALAVLDIRAPAPDAPRMLLVCAEGEWHVTPARMAALRFRDRGWHVDFLGGSQPATTLGAALERLRPPVVAVSCTLVRNLPGARRTIAAVHEHGIPVVVGGAGLGHGDRRAIALGADAWGDDIDAIANTARGWLDRRPDRLRTGRTHHEAEVATIVRREDDLVARVYADLLVELPDGGSDADLELAASDVRIFVRHLAVALDVDDMTVLQEILAPRVEDESRHVGSGRSLVAVGLAAVSRHLGPELPAAQQFIAAMRDAHDSAG